MPTVKVIKPYRFAHQGIRVEEFEPSETPISVSDECALQGIEDGVFEDMEAAEAAQRKAAEEEAAARALAESDAAAEARRLALEAAEAAQQQALQAAPETAAVAAAPETKPAKGSKKS